MNTFVLNSFYDNSFESVCLSFDKPDYGRDCKSSKVQQESQEQ